MSSLDSPQLLRVKQVTSLVCVSRSTLYSWIDQGRFPRPKQIGPRAVAWSREAIEAWIETRPTA